MVQSPIYPLLGPNGDAATSVVWNPVRQLFVAAVRYHGYYQSSDGITWTRLAHQPGAGLTSVLCPTDTQIPGDVACPIYRGTLAVNPQSGDTFAWTVDLNNQDQGIWQDKCAISGGVCTNSNLTFAQQWNTAALETSTLEGAATIANGNYNLALAAVPSGQDTLLLAGANDLWKCSLAMGCEWRNTTNSTTCMSAQVGEFQHALAWNSSNPLEIFLGNDSGLWRSTDAIGETGSACSATDSTHFQNLNGSLGSLAEVNGLSPVITSSYNLMAGLGVNGFAGVKGSAVTADWPQILSGYGGPVAIDPISISNWYVNDQSGVAIYLCSQSAPCTPSAFGTTPVVTRCRCRRRWRRHASARAIPGRSCRRHAVACSYLPRVARSRQPRLDSGERHQPHPLRRSFRRRLQWQRAHPFHHRARPLIQTRPSGCWRPTSPVMK